MLLIKTTNLFDRQLRPFGVAVFITQTMPIGMRLKNRILKLLVTPLARLIGMLFFFLKPIALVQSRLWVERQIHQTIGLHFQDLPKFVDGKIMIVIHRVIFACVGVRFTAPLDNRLFMRICARRRRTRKHGMLG